MNELTTHTKEIIYLLLGLVALISAIIGPIITWVKLVEKQKIQDEKISANIKGISEANKILKAALYDNKSMPIFMPKGRCKEMRDECAKHICGKIDSFARTQQSNYIDLRQDFKSLQENIKSSEEKRTGEINLMSTNVALLTQSVFDFKEHTEETINSIKVELRKGNGRVL